MYYNKEERIFHYVPRQYQRNDDPIRRKKTRRSEIRLRCRMRGVRFDRKGGKKMTETETRKFSIRKRMLIYFLDGLAAVIVFFVLLFTLGNFTVRNISKAEIATINLSYAEVCEEYGFPYKIESQYGLTTLDQTRFIEEKEAEGMNSEEIAEAFNEAEERVDEALKKDETYKKAYSRFYSVYVVTVMMCMFVPLLIFQLIVPLCAKKRQTPFMKVFKGALVDRKSGVLLSANRVFLRFLMIFVVEFLSVYLLIGIIGEIFVVVLSLVLISFTDGRLCIHDALTQCRIASAEEAYRPNEK